jgi:hypothetical protein
MIGDTRRRGSSTRHPNHVEVEVHLRATKQSLALRADHAWHCHGRAAIAATRKHVYIAYTCCDATHRHAQHIVELRVSDGVERVLVGVRVGASATTITNASTSSAAALASRGRSHRGRQLATLGLLEIFNVRRLRCVCVCVSVGKSVW